jgi:hypothetical protein
VSVMGCTRTYEVTKVSGEVSFIVKFVTLASPTQLVGLQSRVRCHAEHVVVLTFNCCPLRPFMRELDGTKVKAAATHSHRRISFVIADKV